VSPRQVELLCGRTGHLDRLCARMRLSIESGARLELSDSEAMLLVAEIRRGDASDEEPLGDISAALLSHIERLHLDTYDEID
jgi:hypothetical protein